MTFFETPHRIAQTLKAAVDILGDRPIMLGRELTKVHQEFLRGTAAQLSDQVHSAMKGEFTVVVGPLTKSIKAEPPPDGTIAAEFGFMTENNAGMSRRQAVYATAKRLGLSPRDVYSAIERAKK